MARFEVLVPRTLAEAVDLLCQGTDRRAIAGGTDLLVQMRSGRRAAGTLVSIGSLPELTGIREEDGTTFIGSTTTVAELASNAFVRRRHPALSAAAANLGSVQIRNVATVGGNVCNGAPSADVGLALFALGSIAMVRGVAGTREMPLSRFFRGPGQVDLERGEVLTGLRVPRDADGTRSIFLKHSARSAMDIALVNVFCTLAVDNSETVTSAVISLGAVAPTPIRATQAERLLIGTPRRSLYKCEEEVAGLSAAAARPISDVRASMEYRRHIVGVLVKRALRGLSQ